MHWLLACFGLVALACVVLLFNVSPLLAVELAAGMILSLLHPVNALCLFVHLLYLRPWEIVPTNPLLLLLPRGLGFLCLFSWLIHPGQHGRPNTLTIRLLALLLMFSVWLFLTSFFTPTIVDTQIDWLSTYFKSLIVFIMCIFFIDSERSVSEFKLTVVISALALIVVRLYQYHVEGGSLERLQLSGMFGDSNDLAAVIVVALPFALVPIFDRAANLGQQLAGLLFTGLSFLVIWYAQSRGAMLGLVIQALTAGYLKTKGKQRIGILILAGGLGLGYTAALRAIPRDSGEMQASSDDRITYWKTAINMTLHHPLFGVGYDQYPTNYESYLAGVTNEWGERTAHSSWLLAFAESGVPGGILFLSFFAIVLKTAWRNRELWPDQLYAVVGYGVVMSFLSHTYEMYIYLLAGLIMASDSLKDRST